MEANEKKQTRIKGAKRKNKYPNATTSKFIEFYIYDFVIVYIEISSGIYANTSSNTSLILDTAKNWIFSVISLFFGLFCFHSIKSRSFSEG